VLGRRQKTYNLFFVVVFFSRYALSMKTKDRYGSRSRGGDELSRGLFRPGPVEVNNNRRFEKKFTKGTGPRHPALWVCRAAGSRPTRTTRGHARSRKKLRGLRRSVQSSREEQQRVVAFVR